MKTSVDGRARIRAREGEKLTAYRDSVGVWTIGVGHTGRASAPPVIPGMIITKEQSDYYLSNDLIPMEDVVNAALPDKSVNQNQFDALVSLAFNIGPGEFRTSTCARKLKSGDIKGAAEAILLWNKPPEIKGRRLTEYNQFLAPVSSVVVTKVPTVIIPPVPIPSIPHRENIDFWTWIANLFAAWFHR